MSESFDKEGYLHTRKTLLVKGKNKQKKWSCYFFVLIGSTLYYYSDVEDQEPKGKIELKEADLVCNEPASDDENVAAVVEKSKKGKEKEKEKEMVFRRRSVSNPPPRDTIGTLSSSPSASYAACSSASASPKAPRKAVVNKYKKDMERQYTLFLKQKQATTDKTKEEEKSCEWEFLLATKSREDWVEWVAALKANTNKEPQPPLSKEKRKAGALRSLRQRTTKNVVGKVATSTMGKRAVKARIPPEVTNLVAAMKHIIEKESGSAKKGADIERDILKIGVKCYFALSAGNITVAQILPADQPLRKALNIFCRCQEHVSVMDLDPSKVDMKKLHMRLEEVQMLARQAASVLKTCLRQYMQPKNLARIDEVVAYCANPKVLTKILLDPSLAAEVWELTNAASHYSQFHIYADE
ncbi:hypothetical protein QOT17_006408 [Balamuthia mandrillaris]